MVVDCHFLLDFTVNMFILSPPGRLYCEYVHIVTDCSVHVKVLYGILSYCASNANIDIVPIVKVSHTIYCATDFLLCLPMLLLMLHSGCKYMLTIPRSWD